MKAREFLAWAAGFIDGDGCFSSSHSGGCVLQIGQSNPLPHPPSVLIRMEAGFGGSLVGPYYSTPNRMPQYSWSVQGFSRVQAILAAIWPWLGEVKRNQALAVLNRDNQRRQIKRRGVMKIPIGNVEV